MMDIKRFFAKVLLDDSDKCWVWQASLRNGYGQFSHNGSPQYAHRVVYEEFVGPIPEGLVLDHVVCQNPPCVNYTHVEPTTQAENVLRGNSLFAQRARATHCARGHEFTEENTYRRPSDGRRRCRACM